MFYRKATTKLSSWKATPNKALLIYGARQVGKSTLIESFIKQEFKRSFTINFASDLRALNLLLQVRNLQEFNDRLQLLMGEPFEKGESVLFLDEIQEYYAVRDKRIKENPKYAEEYVDILTLAKPIAEADDYRLILSGSMLGVTLFNINLNPTGYVDSFTMYPMDFEEYLLSWGYTPSLLKELEEHYQNHTQVPSSLHEEIMAKWKEYLLVGGMPEAVMAYQKQRQFKDVKAVHENIDAWYRRDIMKYAPVDSRLVIAEMYDVLPSEIATKNRKFTKSHLDLPNFKNLELKDRFLWLSSAGIALPVFNVTNPAFPLRISVDSKLVKLFSSDVGMLSSALLDAEGKTLYLAGELHADLGALMENAIAEELHSHGYPPYYHSLKKDGEIDFIIEKAGKVYPIEVKSGQGGERYIYEHKALDKMLSNHPEVTTAYVFGDSNVFKESDHIVNLPLYMIMFLRKE